MTTTSATDTDTDGSSGSSGTSGPGTTTGPGTTSGPGTTTTDPSTSGTTASETTGPGTTTDVTATDSGGPTCDDGVMNGDESDVDCGGSCSFCGDGLMCGGDADCQSGTCDQGVCATPDPCTNGVLDGDESDVDCGGGTCPVCEGGAMCNTDDDCLAKCTDGICDIPECLEDIECAGLDSDCTVGACVDFACVANAINDDGPCEDDDLCTSETTCTGGVCGGGVVPDCSDLDGQCGVGICDPESGTCVVDPVADDTPCALDLGCGNAAACSGGVCVDPMGEALFYEPFANNDQGWTLDNEWAIGPAVAGCGDPGTDHTPTDDNGVAGVVLGGCAAKVVHGYYCLTSPKVDTSQAKDLFMSYWRDLYSDYTPYMKNKIEVWDGAQWNILFETFGSPGVNDANWTFFEYDITPYVNAEMQVRWCFNVGNSGVFSRGSWNVDDVVFGAKGCAPY